MSKAALGALLAKYREILRLRHEPADDPRVALRALSARFPGALRELDEQPLAVLLARESALADAVSGRGDDPPWAAWIASYHGWLRVGLRMKRARRHDDLESAATAAHAAHAPAYDDEPVELTVDDVRSMLAPPEGRLARWVLARVARQYQVPDATVASVLFARSARI